MGRLNKTDALLKNLSGKPVEQQGFSISNRPEGSIVMPNYAGINQGAKLSSADPFITQTNADTRYVNVTGDTMTSNLAIDPGYIEITNIATPSNPSATKRRLFMDSSTGKLSARTSAGTTISLEEQGVSDHGGLTGLSDDDHTQYLLTNGTRALSGSWAANNSITGLTSLSVDNVRIDLSTIDTTLSNGNLLINANGTGSVRVGSKFVIDNKDFEIQAGLNEDITLTFTGTTFTGVMLWMEDEDYFQFNDDIILNSTEKILFRDTGLYINSSVDGQLDVVADTLLQLGSTGNLELNDGVNIVLGTTTGTKIGTATGQKIGFYGVTPVVQASNYTQTYSNTSRIHNNSTFNAVSEEASGTFKYGYTQAQADSIPVELNDLADDVDNLKRVVNSLIDDLQAIGIIS